MTEQTKQTEQTEQTDFIIDIYSAPAYHWLMFLKHNNLAFLRHDCLNLPPNKVQPDNSEESIVAYENINDQIIDEFGLNASFIAQKEIEKKIILLKLEFIIKGKKVNRTQWKIKEADINKPEQDKIDMSLSKEIAIVSKNLGVGIIDIKDYSIFQYLTAKNHTT